MAGVNTDGLPDLLGVWLTAANDTWPTIASSLYERGLERVNVIIDRAGGQAAEALQAVYPRATVIRSPLQAIGDMTAAIPRGQRSVARAVLMAAIGAGEPVEDLLESLQGKGRAYVIDQLLQLTMELSPLARLPEKLRSQVMLADQVAQSLGDALAASLKRHGPFHSEKAALDFSANVLLRAEHRFNRAMGQGHASRPFAGDADPTATLGLPTLRPLGAMTAGT